MLTHSSARRRRGDGLLGILLAGMLLSGCRTGDGSPAAPPAPVTRAPGAPRLDDVTKLDTEHDVRFRVKAAPRSPAVVEHYDTELLKRGWKKAGPTADDPAGARKWLSTGAKVGPADLFDARWTDPATGRVAELNLWHRAETEDVKEGTFAIHEKGESP
jgi:hypothetical protein